MTLRVVNYLNIIHWTELGQLGLVTKCPQFLFLVVISKNNATFFIRLARPVKLLLRQKMRPGKKRRLQYIQKLFILKHNVYFQVTLFSSLWRTNETQWLICFLETMQTTKRLMFTLPPTTRRLTEEMKQRPMRRFGGPFTLMCPRCTSS